MNASTEKSNPISFTINGRAITATAGTYVLQAARQAGIEIPTLCDHPAVEPVGACRLCMIEVTHPSWNGWSGLMTSCLYPVAEGIQVQTDSPRVRQARRHVLSLLAARCPTSPLIQKLAKQYEALTACLQVNPEADQCILCGLCTRVCESYATAAITTYNRGTTKAVGAFAEQGPIEQGPEQGPAECVGCGACAMICPTQHIKAERSAEGYAIWNKVFPALVCAADEARCIGCGACEEACPFSVARIQLRQDQSLRAIIPAEHCRGCGVCVGACPSGAISQKNYSWSHFVEKLLDHQRGE